MARHDCDVTQIRVRVVFHIMRMAFRAVMHLPCGCGLRQAVTVERGRTADYVDYLAVARMGMQTARRSGAERAFHYLTVAVDVVACQQFAMSALESNEGFFGDIVKVYNHSFVFWFHVRP